MTDLYVDYDDMVKAKDEAEYDVKYGTFTVQIVNFIAEEYNKLSDYDKMALKSFADWLDDAPGVSLLSGIVELLDGWVIKDVELYSDEELVEAGRKITDAVSDGYDLASEPTNSMEIYRGDSRLPEYIPVGTSSADGLFDIRLSYYEENSGYWGSYITVEEFKEAGGTVNAEFDFSSKGFKTVTVTLSDVDYTYTEISKPFGTVIICTPWLWKGTLLRRILLPTTCTFLQLTATKRPGRRFGLERTVSMEIGILVLRASILPAKAACI